MHFRFRELSGGTGGLAWGEALRWAGGFVGMEADEIAALRMELS